MIRPFIVSAITLLLPTVLAAQSASVGLLKQEAPNPIVAGADAVYTLEISSEGPGDAASVTVTDPLPSGTTFAAINTPAGWSCTTPPAGSNGSINCSIALFSPGTASLQITVHTDPTLTSGSTISNTATVTSTTPDPDPNDNTSTVDTPVESHSDLGVSKNAAPTPAVNAGSTLTYTINYTASGPSSDANLTITDALPAGTTFTSINAPGLSCTTPPAGTNGTVTCSAASLAAGASGSLSVVVGVDPSLGAGTVLGNTATISGDSIDSNSANDSSTATVTTTVSADLAVSKNAAATVTAGSQLTYSLGFSSAGPSNASGATLTDVLPANTTFVSLASPAGWSCGTPAVGAGGTVSCTNPTLAPGASGSFTLVVQVDPATPDGTTISNTVTLSSTSPDPTTPNTATANTLVTTQTDLAVTISGVPDPVFPSQPLTYTVGVTRSGSSAALGATLTVNLSPLTTFNSVVAPAGWNCTTPAVGSSGTITCTNPLFALSSDTFTINTTTVPTLTSGATITTVASVSSASTDPVPSNNQATATNIGATFTGTKTVVTSGAPGSAVVYTIVLHNGGSNAQGDNPGDELTDVLPSSLILVSATATAGTTVADVPNNTVHWNGSIPAGGSVTVTINATIASTASGVISNQGTIHYDTNSDGTNDATGVTNAPAGGPTTFAAAVVVGSNVPTLSNAMLLLMGAALAGVALMKRA